MEAGFVTPNRLTIICKVIFSLFELSWLFYLVNRLLLNIFLASKLIEFMKHNFSDGWCFYLNAGLVAVSLAAASKVFTVRSIQLVLMLMQYLVSLLVFFFQQKKTKNQHEKARVVSHKAHEGSVTCRRLRTQYVNFFYYTNKTPLAKVTAAITPFLGLSSCTLRKLSTLALLLWSCK